MDGAPTRHEADVTPEQGVIFYDEALAAIDPQTRNLITRYPAAVANAELAQAMLESKPYFALSTVTKRGRWLDTEWKYTYPYSNARVADDYAEARKKELTTGDPVDEALETEMAWRLRFAEEASAAVDMGRAIVKQLLVKVPPSRDFEAGIMHGSQGRSFIDVVRDNVSERAQTIGLHDYGLATVRMLDGRDVPMLARFDDKAIKVFGDLSFRDNREPEVRELPQRATIGEAIFADSWQYYLDFEDLLPKGPSELTRFTEPLPVIEATPDEFIDLVVDISNPAQEIPPRHITENFWPMHIVTLDAQHKSNRMAWQYSVVTAEETQVAHIEAGKDGTLLAWRASYNNQGLAVHVSDLSQVEAAELWHTIKLVLASPQAKEKHAELQATRDRFEHGLIGFIERGNRRIRYGRRLKESPLYQKELDKLTEARRRVTFPPRSFTIRPNQSLA